MTADASAKLTADTGKALLLAQRTTEQVGMNIGTAIGALESATANLADVSKSHQAALTGLVVVTERQRADLYAAVAEASKAGIGLIHEQIIPVLETQSLRTVEVLNEVGAKLDLLAANQADLLSQLQQVGADQKRTSGVAVVLLSLMLIVLVAFGVWVWLYVPPLVAAAETASANRGAPVEAVVPKSTNTPSPSTVPEVQLTTSSTTAASPFPAEVSPAATSQATVPTLEQSSAEEPTDFAAPTPPRPASPRPSMTPRRPLQE
jgi:hypothetical protein